MTLPDPNNFQTPPPEPLTLLQFWVTPDFVNSLTPYIPEGETLAHVIQRASYIFVRLKQEDAAGDPASIVSLVRTLFTP